MRRRRCLSVPARLCIVLAVLQQPQPARGAGWPPLPGSSLNVTEIVWQPEHTQVYLGSPSIIRQPGSGAVLASHDYFGAGATAPAGYPQSVAVVHAAPAAGGAFAAAGRAEGLYWATLFSRPGDAAVYLMGVSDDSAAAGAAIARSADGGASWQPSPAAILAPGAGGAAFSTGPTPVLLHAGRLWRAYERNRGTWASGYSAVVLSAPADAPDLTAPAAWTASAELPFSAVLPAVPPAWARVAGGHEVAAPLYGWLEGNAVQPEDAADAGVYVVLRVNAGPTANQAALLRLAAPAAAPVFQRWLAFPGGQTKFSIRRDNETGLYVTLANALPDSANRASLPPACGAVPQPAAPLPCCGFLGSCDEAAAAASCLWCHAVARNSLSLCFAPRAAGNWSCAAAPLLADDTGVPGFVSELFTGFQYADWQFDGADILAAVRAGYRGSNNYHNANRHLLLRVPSWRGLVPAEVLREAAALQRRGARGGGE